MDLADVPGDSLLSSVRGSFSKHITADTKESRGTGAGEHRKVPTDCLPLWFLKHFTIDFPMSSQTIQDTNWEQMQRSGGDIDGNVLCNVVMP